MPCEKGIPDKEEPLEPDGRGILAIDSLPDCADRLRFPEIKDMYTVCAFSDIENLMQYFEWKRVYAGESAGHSH